MSFQRITGLKAEITKLRGVLDGIDSTVAARGTDLTRAESAQYGATITRMETATAALAQLETRTRSMDAIAPINARIAGNVDPRTGYTYEVPNMGEQLLTRGLATLGRDNGGLERMNDTLQRVVAHGVQADGTAPVTIEGDLVKFVDSNRYAVNAARRLPMPDNHAPTFKRPRLSQRTTVAGQAAEGDVLSSQRLQVAGDTVTKLTRGGVLSLSEQEIDWTDPAMLGLAVQDLAESYAIDTDNVLCDAIEAAATANDATETILAASLPTAAAFTTAITSAAAVAYASAKKLPDTLFVDTNWWSRIIAIVDLDGRPLFPFAGSAVNAAGTSGGVASFTGFNVFGLNVVVDPNFTADFMCVGVSSLVEFYEQDKGLLTINAPSTLEVQYAYRGYVAANVYTQGIASIEAA